MRILTIHADYIEVEPMKKAIKDAEELKHKGKERFDEVLVVFTAVEKDDDENSGERLANETKSVADQVKTKKLLLYPLVHLTSKPSSPSLAKKVMAKAESILKEQGFEVSHSPFGWYKGYTLKCKGHPLSELSREFYASETAEISKELVSDNSTYKKLMDFLNQNKATYKLIDHPPEGRTAIVSKMRGNLLSQAAHCIIVMIDVGKNKKKYILAVVPGDSRVDMDAVKLLFNGSYASFADKETAERLSGSISGTILPFTFNQELELVVDPRLLEHDELFFNAARLDKSLILKSSDYKRIAKPTIKSISVISEEGEKDVSNAFKAEKKLVSIFHILDSEGEVHKIEYDKEKKKFAGFDFSNHENLKKFASYEMAKDRAVNEEPPHVALMKKHELVDYEPGSDPGNLRYYPKGRFMKGLIERYVTQVVKQNGGMEIESPIMYDFEHPSLKSYLNRFPARQYTIETPNKKVFLRFAACFGGFLMAHDTNISYKQLPVWLYELTRYSFRVEQRGELTGLRRLRSFTMPDCHAFCKDEGQAKAEIIRRFEMSREMQNKMGINSKNDLEFAIRVTRQFYEKNKEFLVDLVKRWGKPTLLEMWDEQFFYFVFKYEFNFVDNLGKCSALTTDQIDIENAKRYGIEYVDENGEKKNPLILHLSPSGAVERIIYALLEKAAFDMKKGNVPSLPLWLSPTQIRIIPVSKEKHLNFSEKLAERISNMDIRVDVDDRDESVGKKIRNAGQEWTPYTIVVGDKEIESQDKFMVRDRENNQEREMHIEELVKTIKEKTEGMPFDTLPLPRNLSKRIIFVG
ncbi:MAG: threonine--tRNA ligase [Candidatus Micrarchaeota archaeon]